VSNAAGLDDRRSFCFARQRESDGLDAFRFHATTHCICAARKLMSLANNTIAEQHWAGASTPCTWNARFAISNPIMVTRCLAASFSDRTTPSPWHAAKGHEDPFPRPGQNGRCWFDQETFAGVRGNERDAPKPAAPVEPISLQGSDPESRHSPSAKHPPRDSKPTSASLKAPTTIVRLSGWRPQPRSRPH